VPDFFVNHPVATILLSVSGSCPSVLFLEAGKVVNRRLFALCLRVSTNFPRIQVLFEISKIVGARREILSINKADFFLVHDAKDQGFRQEKHRVDRKGFADIETVKLEFGLVFFSPLHFSEVLVDAKLDCAAPCDR
jgi:hypothetical protein